MRRAESLFSNFITKRVGSLHSSDEAPPGLSGRRFIKPLTKIAAYPERADNITYESLRTWHKSPAFAAVTAVFRDYPSNSLVGGIARELLYHLIRSTKAQNVAEVGTYYAATSEVMARALWENGRGILHTTDPFGAERCPFIISRWPEELQRHVGFYPLNSMGFFGELERNRVVLDIAFIDGNHDYEYALFDLASAAKLLRPGGIVLMDNVEQPGPFWAAVEFVRQNPEWTELGNSISNFSASYPFDAERGFIPGTPFVVLKAPEQYVVKSAPRATGQQPYGNKRLCGFRLNLSGAAPDGTLHMQIFLRGFSDEHDPEQLIAVTEANLHGESAFELSLPEPLETKVSSRHTVEIILFWEPSSHGKPLLLRRAPEPFA